MQVLGPSLECHFGSSEGPGVFSFGRAADGTHWTFPRRVDWIRSLRGLVGLGLHCGVRAAC